MKHIGIKEVRRVRAVWRARTVSVLITYRLRRARTGAYGGRHRAPATRSLARSLARPLALLYGEWRLAVCLNPGITNVLHTTLSTWLYLFIRP